MISTGLVQIIFYIKNDKFYKFNSIYDICVGTPCLDIGLSTQKFIDLNSITSYSDKIIHEKNNSLEIIYKIPKTIESEIVLSDFKRFDLEPLSLIYKHILILIDDDFSFDILNDYIRKYSEYGTRKYMENE